MAQLFQFGQTKLPSAEAQRLRGANSHGARAVGAGATGVAALKFQGSQGVKSLGAWLWLCAHASRYALKYLRKPLLPTNALSPCLSATRSASTIRDRSAASLRAC